MALLLGQYSADDITNDTIEAITLQRPTEPAEATWDRFWTPEAEETTVAPEALTEDALMLTRSCPARNMKLAPQSKLPAMRRYELRQEGLFNAKGWPEKEETFFGFNALALQIPQMVASLDDYNSTTMPVAVFPVPINKSIRTLHGKSWKSFTDMGQPQSVAVANLHHVARAVNDLNIQTFNIASTLGVFAHTLVPWAFYELRQGNKTLGSTEKGRLRARFPYQLKSLKEMWIQTSRIPVARHHCDVVVRCLLKVLGPRAQTVRVWGGLSPVTLPVPFVRVQRQGMWVPVGAVPDMLLYDKNNKRILAVEIKTQYSSKARQDRDQREQLRQCATQAFALSFAVTQRVSVVPVLVHTKAGADLADGLEATVHVGDAITSWASQQSRNILADLIQLSKCKITAADGSIITDDVVLQKVAANLRRGTRLPRQARHIFKTMY